VPTVGPERGRSVELGLDWRGAAGDAALTVYRNRVRDLIGYEPDRSYCPASPDYDFGCARNIGRARCRAPR
jgi:vitamin B12 transporter